MNQKYKNEIKPKVTKEQSSSSSGETEKNTAPKKALKSPKENTSDIDQELLNILKKRKEALDAYDASSDSENS